MRDLRKAGWIVLELWVAEPGNRGHARRRFSAAQAYCTEPGREAVEVMGGWEVKVGSRRRKTHHTSFQWSQS
jgi:hypothetical protein